MVTTFYPPYGFGGDANFVRDLSRELVARGHSVEVIHCRDSYRALGGDPPRPASSDPTNIRVHALEGRWKWLSPLATHQAGRPLFNARQIESVLSRPFDVIHYHNISLVGGPKVLEFGDAVKLYTWHEYWLVCPTNLLMRDGRTPCTERRCTQCMLRQGRPPQWWRGTNLLSKSLRSVNAFLSPSRFGIERHRELGLTQPVVHLPTFVPPVERCRRSAQGDPYFLYAGRLEYSKGPQTLIEPFLRWNQARLVVAGAGAGEAALRKAAGAGGRIEIRGQVAMEELRDLYRNAVALIVPSLTYELFPLVILEAFREGTPVIVRNRGSLPEAVEDSGGGFVYNDDRELIQCAGRLLESEALRDELGERGLRAVSTRWSAETHMRRYLGLVEELGVGRGRELVLQ